MNILKCMMEYILHIFKHFITTCYFQIGILYLNGKRSNEM